jgi:hypothetical protein
MTRRLLIAWLVVFVAWMAGSFVVHGLLLGADYTQLANLFRQPPEAQKYFPLMILAHVIMSGAFVWIYARGAEPKPWLGQGVRFGIAVALLTAVPWYLIYYVVQPMPLETVLKQMVFDGALVVLLGVIAAFVLRRVNVG